MPWLNPLLQKAIEFSVDHLLLVFGGLSFFVIAWSSISRRKKHEKAAKKILQKTMETQSHEPATLHPEIDAALCAGCGSCTEVCPEGDILRLIDHKAVLVAPSKCVGHGECEAVCPNNAITLVFGTKTRGMEIPRISPHYETNVPGLYIAGELGGMGLIRNAIKQGHLAAVHALSHIKSTTEKTDVDLMIIGAGPAGFTAALTAIAQRKSYMCIDQNTLGGAVANFPRQKLVMSAPADLPIVGKMKFPSNKVSKEELIDYWRSIQKKTGLKVHEKTHFETLEVIGNIFAIKTSRGIVKAKKVILALGVRGSPRKLGLPNEDLSKVAYNLIDPFQYRNQNIAVVGAGNAGVEAAQYLARDELQNKVRLLVRGAALDRCNEENMRIIKELEARGRVKIQYQTSVAEIEKAHLLLKTPEGPVKIANDYLFVFAGAEMPFKFLMSLGIKIDKKFGEAIKKTAS